MPNAAPAPRMRPPRPEGPAAAKGTRPGLGLLGRADTAETAGPCPLQKAPGTEPGHPESRGLLRRCSQGASGTCGPGPAGRGGHGPPPPGRGSARDQRLGAGSHAVWTLHHAARRERAPRVGLQPHTPTSRAAVKAAPNMPSAARAPLAPHPIPTLRVRFPESRRHVGAGRAVENARQHALRRRPRARCVPRTPPLTARPRPASLPRDWQRGPLGHWTEAHGSGSSRPTRIWGSSPEVGAPGHDGRASP